VELARGGLSLSIVHQTGKDDREPTVERYRAAGLQADVRDFIDDMACEYARADLVVSRAGATSVAELAVVGRPAILIPYPFAADDHQTTNARELAQAGAALVFPQSELDGPKLGAAIRDLAADAPRRARMAAAMKSLGRPDAADAIVGWIEVRASASGA
jgi:UDP-N-acetylglucosamine--N-acetylmuramyl-(pentapeptide) pyrophosphoryl-undecaprenol N-acetylglucosamine transferase